MAPRQELESRFTTSKAAVLPLDERGILCWLQVGESNTFSRGYKSRAFPIKLTWKNSVDLKRSLRFSLSTCAITKHDPLAHTLAGISFLLGQSNTLGLLFSLTYSTAYVKPLQLSYLGRVLLFKRCFWGQRLSLFVRPCGLLYPGKSQESRS